MELLLAVHGEGDSLAAELVGDELFETLHLGGAQIAERFDDAAVGVADRPVGLERFVVRLARLVSVE